MAYKRHRVIVRGWPGWPDRVGVYLPRKMKRDAWEAAHREDDTQANFNQSIKYHGNWTR